MKFKAPGNEPVMVALLSGHTCTIPPEGTVVEPRFRKEAIARGCVPMGIGEEPAEPKAAPTRFALICSGIEKLIEGNDDSAFTNDGKPDVRKLSEVVGMTVTARERDEAWAAVEAELKGDEKDGD
jgi:hypothetical protein